MGGHARVAAGGVDVTWTFGPGRSNVAPCRALCRRHERGPDRYRPLEAHFGFADQGINLGQHILGIGIIKIRGLPEEN